MRISNVALNNFKRFTALKISAIPETARLVVVVGPNGSGKSSLFDAFLQWYRTRVGFGEDGDHLYFRKDQATASSRHSEVEVALHNQVQPKKGCMYVRSAYRHDPDFGINQFARLNNPAEEMILQRTIVVDMTVSQNYQRLVYETMSGVYDRANDNKSVQSLRDELIGDLRESMRKVFGDVLLDNISDPLGDGTFYFSKGPATHYHYKNLSGGEKAAFDLLLDFHIKKKFFSDTIYCIDEVETHLHTKVQGSIVKELVSIIPEPCQLWVTTHSLGVLRAAQELNASKPGSVCVIDFDISDPDVPSELLPSSLGRVTWEKVLSLTLDDLSTRITPKHIIVCEGSTVGSRRKNFDAEIYGRILGSHFPEFVFVSGGSSSEVGKSQEAVRKLMGELSPNTEVYGLLDRDDLSDAEVAQKRSLGAIVLPRRNLESFLLDEEVIQSLVEKEQKNGLLSQALQIRTDAIQNSVNRGNAADDLKSAAGEIYNGLKSLLALTQCGNDKDTFMRDSLAPLVKPGLNVFEELKASIVDPVVNKT